MVDDTNIEAQYQQEIGNKKDENSLLLNVNKTKQ